VNVQIAAGYRQACHALNGDANAGLTRTTQTLLFFA
jgi:hypothetical protein